MDGVIVEKIPVNRFFRRKVGFHFGMYPWLAIAEEYNVSLDDMGDAFDEEEAKLLLFYYAADWYAYINGKRRPSKKMIGKSLKYMPYQQVKRIGDVMAKAKIGGKSIMDIASDHKKKQQQKT